MTIFSSFEHFRNSSRFIRTVDILDVDSILSENDIFWGECDLINARNIHDAIRIIATVFRFPHEMHGYTIDGFEDWIQDLSWLPHDKMVIVLRHCERLAAERFGDWMLLLEVLLRAADLHTARNRRFRVVVVESA